MLGPELALLDGDRALDEAEGRGLRALGSSPAQQRLGQQVQDGSGLEGFGAVLRLHLRQPLPRQGFGFRGLPLAEELLALIQHAGPLGLLEVPGREDGGGDDETGDNEVASEHRGPRICREEALVRGTVS